MPVKVIAPSASPARVTASASSSDSPEHARTNVRPPGGSAEARSAGWRRRGAMSLADPSLHVFVEVRLWLLLEGAHPLLRLLAFVEQFDRTEGGQADAADVLAVGVERTLGERQRGRRTLDQNVRPRLDRIVQLRRPHDLVDEPH